MPVAVPPPLLLLLLVLPVVLSKCQPLGPAACAWAPHAGGSCRGQVLHDATLQLGIL